MLIVNLKDNGLKREKRIQRSTQSGLSCLCVVLYCYKNGNLFRLVQERGNLILEVLARMCRACEQFYI